MYRWKWGVRRMETWEEEERMFEEGIVESEVEAMDRLARIEFAPEAEDESPLKG